MNPQTQFPPVSLNQMPQWARVGHLDKARYPKPFSKDQLRTSIENDQTSEKESSSSFLDSSEDQNPAVRVQYLERNIKFLKSQHQEVLSSLHSEIEKLRAENKELHFKMIMNHGESVEGLNNEVKSLREPGPLNSDHNSALELYLREKTMQKGQGAVEESILQQLQQQIVELKHQIRELKSKNSYLMQLVEAETQSRKEKNVMPETHERRAAQSSACFSEISIDMDRVNLTNLGKSVMVHSTQDGSTRRRPNQQELERIVLYLHRANEQQEAELKKLKSDLKEMLYSQKLTPDAYLLAKAYVAQESLSKETDLLPKIQLRSGARKLPEIAYISKDNISLPALKQTMGTKAAERRKRTQILQKARLHKEIS